MLQRELEHYVEKMREEEYASDCAMDVEEEDGRQMMSNLSQSIAVYFNKIIYSINYLKNSSDYCQSNETEPVTPKQKPAKTSKTDSAAGDFMESNFQSSDKRLEECANQQEIDEMKDLDEIYRVKEGKLDNMPKKPISSFFMYYQDHSKEFTAQVGEVGGSRLAQLVAQSWRQLPLEVKKTYYDRVAADKKRYAEQITKYIQEHPNELDDIKRLQRLKKFRSKKGNDQGESDIISSKIKGISQRQIKAADRKNYSHRPKAPVSSFFIYYQKEANNIAQKYGETVGSRLARLASSIWKGMNKQQKEQYQQLAKVERERYHQEMIQYKIDYPEEIENRRKKISNSMKKALRQHNQLIKEQDDESDQESSSLSVVIEDKKSNSNQQSSVQSNSYISSQDQKKSSEAQQKVKNKRKQKEDPMPHKPKGPICSFFQYYHAHMHEFMKKQGDQRDAGSEFVRRASNKWKTLSEEEKQIYHEMARVDRGRYQKEMSHFQEAYPQEYEAFLEITKKKQLNKKKKKLAKLQELKDMDLDDIDMD